MLNIREVKRFLWVDRQSQTVAFIFIVLALIAYITGNMTNSMGFLLLISLESILALTKTNADIARQKRDRI